jgi:pepF/M3 family oligoendopeptidase
MTTATALPRWDLTPAFASPEAPELDAMLASLRSRYAELDEVLARPVEGNGVAAVEEILGRANAAQRDLDLVSAFLYAWNSADTTDQVAAGKLSELYELRAVAEVAAVRVTSRLGGIDVDDAVERSEVAREHEHFLRTTAIEAGHLMSLAEEELAAKLRPGAGSAWSRLREDVSTTLAGNFEVDGEERERPISEITNLRNHPDRDVRRRAYEAEEQLWRKASVPVAASLNGIKNEALVLCDRRGWADPLDMALHQNAIDRNVLDAMIAAMERTYDELRGHMRRRARMLGTERLAWFDMTAPLGEVATTYTFDEARELLFQTVAPLSPRLEAMLHRAFDERWIDAEPRSGKMGGAYCTEIFPHGPRVLMNYDGSLSAVSTLAHELGHAFHDICLEERTPLQRTLPMTLAETASMLLQHMLEDVLLEQAPNDGKLTLLNARLNDAIATILDLRSRFEFERSLFAARRRRALSVDELCALTLDAQELAFGDGLDPELRSPMRWASKPHYYIVDLDYYNFPYQFGLLFGLGLYQRYQDDPAGFAEPYERLLSRTGMAPAADLASEFGIDLRDEAFWSSSLDHIRADVARFAELTPEAG